MPVLEPVELDVVLVALVVVPTLLVVVDVGWLVVIVEVGGAA